MAVKPGFFYKAQNFVNTTSQGEWSTDTASPHFSGSQVDTGSPSDGSTISVSRTMTEETVGILVRDGEVTKSAPANVKIIESP